MQCQRSAALLIYVLSVSTIASGNLIVPSSQGYIDSDLDLCGYSVPAGAVHELAECSCVLLAPYTVCLSSSRNTTT